MSVPAQVTSKSATPPPPWPRGSIVFFTDFFTHGLDVKELQPAVVKRSNRAPAFGMGCLEIELSPRPTEQGVSLFFSGSWPGQGRHLSVGKDLRPYQEKGAITFWLRCATGKENLVVTLASLSRADHDIIGERQRSSYERVVSLTRYAEMSTAWQKVIIPLADFLDNENLLKAISYGHAMDVKGYKRIRWDEIEELRFQTVGEPDYGQKIYIDELGISTGYSKQTLKLNRKRASIARQARVTEKDGTIWLFDDDLRATHSRICGGEPGEYLVVDETIRMKDKKSLRCTLAPFSMKTGYPSIQLHLDFIDLTSYQKKGHVEFWAKGAESGTSFSMGFASPSDKGLYYTALLLDTRAYQFPDTEWKKYRIPLADFDMKKDENWGLVGALIIHTSGNERENVWWIDDFKIVPW